jgi:hypothetical protein
MRLAAEPCRYRWSPSRQYSVGMTTGRPPWRKPTWQRMPSSRIASMVARS